MIIGRKKGDKSGKGRLLFEYPIFAIPNPYWSEPQINFDL
jgi:hypothetical protein